MRVDPSLLVAVLRERYTIGEQISCELLREGFNDNYVVTAGDERYVLRLYLNDKYYIESSDDFRFELDLLTHLRARAVPVAAPVPQRDGSTLGSLDGPNGTRWFALFPFAPGAQPDGREAIPVAAFGRGVARMHVEASAFSSPHRRYALDRTYLIDEPVRLMAAVYDRFDRGSLKNWEPQFSRMRSVLDALPRGDGAFGIIHGDLHGRNLHVDGDTFTLFDFDHSGYGWRAYDLATVKLGLGDRFDGFLEAYSEVRAPAAEELNAIPTFEVLRFVWDIGDVLAMHAAWKKDVPERACEEIANVLARVEAHIGA